MPPTRHCRRPTRAELHERFADWFETTGRPRRARRDAGLPPRAGGSIQRGTRPTRRTTWRHAPPRDSERRAFAHSIEATWSARSTSSVAQQRCSRRPTDARIELELELGEALLEAGRLSEAESLLEQTTVDAAQSDQPLLRLRAQLGLVSVPMQTGGEKEHPQLRRDLEPLVAVFEEAGDHRDAANALRLLGVLAAGRGPRPPTSRSALSHTPCRPMTIGALKSSPDTSPRSRSGAPSPCRPRLSAAVRSSTKHRTTREGSSRRAV